MHWNELIAEITAENASGSSTEPVTGIEYDSRRIKSGAIGVDVGGESTHHNRNIDKPCFNAALTIPTVSHPSFYDLILFREGRRVLEAERGRPALHKVSEEYKRKHKRRTFDLMA